MIFQVHVTVVLSRQVFALNDSHWVEAVSYTFGINAEDAGVAAGLAERAAEHARDRNGDYIGGVVAEVQMCRVRVEEFKGYEDYLLQPISAPGIFYVTGTTTFQMPSAMVAGTLIALEASRDSIRKSGLPQPSFVHPMPPDPPPPKRTRLLCPGCHKWAEFDSTGIIYSLYEGLDPALSEHRIGQQSGRRLGVFIEEHASCLKLRSHIAFVFLHEGDPRYDALDPAMAV
jgi:hypothetical protein